MENATRYKCQMSGCPFVSTIEAPVCEEHLDRIGSIYMTTRSHYGTFLHLRERLNAGRALVEEDRRTREERDRPRSIVYYMRIGDHVKIGFTTSLRTRINDLRVDVDHVLAAEPGWRDLESRRHVQFADERVGRRENFNPSRRLLAHIASVREQHGDPLDLAGSLQRPAWAS